MRALLVALAALVAAGCIDEIDARWALDHDHVVAARATPPRVRDGESTVLDALVAREGQSPIVVNPMGAELVNEAPNGLTRTLTQDIDGRWNLDVTMLSRAGLESGPIPVDVLLTFANQSPRRATVDPFKVKKTVWVGEPALNPLAPPILVAGIEIAADGEVVVPLDRDVYIEVADAAGLRVNWLTNVGTLFQDDNPRAFVHVKSEDTRTGELVLVVRDDVGGVDWRVLPMRAE
jgi:hypothetical protein